MLGEFLGNALRNSGYAHELAKVDKLFIHVAPPFRKRRRRRRARRNAWQAPTFGQELPHDSRGLPNVASADEH